MLISILFVPVLFIKCSDFITVIKSLEIGTSALKTPLSIVNLEPLLAVPSVSAVISGGSILDIGL